MNLETKITIYKFTPQLFTLTQFRIIGIHGKKTVTKDQFRLSFFYNRSDIYFCTT